MVNKKLNAYKGQLTPAQAAAGMNAAMQNARRLTEDAEHLLERGAFPSAASLAILAIEEAGKVSILRAIAVARTEQEAKEEWREYRSHTKKNVTWMLPELVADGARNLDDFQPLVDEEAEHPFLLDQLKQLGFYTDCLGNGRWVYPRDVIPEEIAGKIVKVAELFSSRGDVTEREIELWVEHMQPVWKTEWMKQGLVNWHDAMVANGLASDKGAMEQFVFGELTGDLP